MSNCDKKGISLCIGEEFVPVECFARIWESASTEHYFHDNGAKIILDDVFIHRPNIFLRLTQREANLIFMSN